MGLKSSSYSNLETSLYWSCLIDPYLLCRVLHLFSKLLDVLVSPWSQVLVDGSQRGLVQLSDVVRMSPGPQPPSQALNARALCV